ncbi:endonuclease/exonuclease/phosphatase family protein [Mycobacterium hodleri]|uniref:endonuclease/exonuclease/phosphatase family protein n=1 Tax=Mycolicibacterium hodleri TaxID=49897 RepID=UPI0021F2D0A1|nr:endonuclease/exonuclease/phosphatase family protein [Mycolicibacterium hodleri]MCV7136643.1 endonuclease/exonuclease/phosphatase family protein [Mycolicibacterium hodleri]
MRHDAIRGGSLTTARRVVAICLGVALILAAAAALVVRFTPIPTHGVLYVVIAAPYLMLAAPVAVVVLVWVRRWVLAAVAALLTAVLVALQVPWFVGATPDPASVAVRTMTVNMLYGLAEPDAIARVAAADADVLMVQELTPAAARGLAAAGIDDTFPYQSLDARPVSAGVGIYSRHPITDSTRIPGYQLAMVRADVRIPRVAHEVSLLTVHLDAPWPRPISGWQGDIAKFPATLAQVAGGNGDGAVIVGGDFNSTIDMVAFRRLLTNGYQDAARQAGSGRNLTFPSNEPYPPVLGIDHVLTRKATATSTKTVELPGTDHRALLVTVMVPTA